MTLLPFAKLGFAWDHPMILLTDLPNMNFSKQGTSRQHLLTLKKLQHFMLIDLLILIILQYYLPQKNGDQLHSFLQDHRWPPPYTSIVKRTSQSAVHWQKFNHRSLKKLKVLIVCQFLWCKYSYHGQFNLPRWCHWAGSWDLMHWHTMPLGVQPSPGLRCLKWPGMKGHLPLLTRELLEAFTKYVNKVYYIL